MAYKLRGDSHVTVANGNDKRFDREIREAQPTPTVIVSWCGGEGSAQMKISRHFRAALWPLIISTSLKYL
jgi:hypothetical protein